PEFNASSLQACRTIAAMQAARSLSPIMDGRPVVPPWRRRTHERWKYQTLLRHDDMDPRVGQWPLRQHGLKRSDAQF
ncbi:MAG: hypothetical protein ABI870_00135, partial [Rhodanobacter sp.]